MRKIWDEESEQYLIKNYETKTRRELAEDLGVTTSAIQNKARKLGLKKKSKYTWDRDFFKKIDTKEKAYWLGFIYADGYIHTSKINNELGIELAKRDIKHLKKFNKSIGGNFEIHTRTRESVFLKGTKKQYTSKSEMCNIRIYSKEFANSLNLYGDFHNKTYKKQHMLKIDENFYIPFLRGFFDGDGSICIDTKNAMRLDITNANNLILEDIREFLYKKYNICSYITEEKKDGATIPCYKLNFKGMVNTYKLCNLLYEDLTYPYLERKYYIYKNYINSTNVIERANKRGVFTNPRYEYMSE
jgi:hypothetical protein